MPNLPPRTSVLINIIGRVPPRNFVLKLRLVPHGVKLDGILFCRREDGRLFWEVAVVGVIERVLDEVADEHFHSRRRGRGTLEVVRGDARIASMFGVWLLLEKYVGIVVYFLLLLRFVLLGAVAGRERWCACEESRNEVLSMGKAEVTGEVMSCAGSVKHAAHEAHSAEPHLRVLTGEAVAYVSSIA